MSEEVLDTETYYECKCENTVISMFELLKNRLKDFNIELKNGVERNLFPEFEDFVINYSSAIEKNDIAYEKYLERLKETEFEDYDEMSYDEYIDFINNES